jgi:hypothetical protein
LKTIEKAGIYKEIEELTRKIWPSNQSWETEKDVTPRGRFELPRG